MGTNRLHQEFLATCLGNRMGLVRGGTLRTALSPPDALFALASSESLLPALYPRLRDLNLLPQIPSAVSEGLKAVHQLNLDRNQLILSQARTLIGLLNNAGIEPIALKGLAYLLSGPLPDPGMRYVVDLDLLVPRLQLPAAICAISQNGYSPETGDSFAQFRHHAPQMKRAGGITVELHHCVGLGLPSAILPSSEVILCSSPVEWHGVRLRLPSPEHLATHLIIHSQIQHSYAERIWPPLRAMYDLILVERHFGPSLNWPSIQNRFRTNGEHATLLLHLLQVHQTLRMPLPFPIHLGPIAKLRWLRRRLLNRHPILRFFDPYYLFMSAFSRRFRLLRAIFTVPGGWKKALKAFSTARFYRRVLSGL